MFVASRPGNSCRSCENFSRLMVHCDHQSCPQWESALSQRYDQIDLRVVQSYFSNRQTGVTFLNFYTSRLLYGSPDCPQYILFVFLYDLVSRFMGLCGNLLFY